MQHTLSAMRYLFQTPPVTPTAPASPLLAPPDQIPYLVLLAVALVIFLLGLFARPLLEDQAGAFRVWVKSLGKASDFQQRYLNWIIREYRHSSLLPANVVAAR